MDTGHKIHRELKLYYTLPLTSHLYPRTLETVLKLKVNYSQLELSITRK